MDIPRTSTKPSPRFGAALAYRIEITRAALEDAFEYAAFIRDDKHSERAAELWLDGLYAATRELDELPARFPVIPEADELGFPYRSIMFHSHRIV